MNLKKLKINPVDFGALSFIVTSAVAAYLRENLDAIIFAVLIFIAMLFLIANYKEMRLSNSLIIGICGYLILQIIGLLIVVENTQLIYASFTFFSYENILYAYAAALFTVVAYNFISPYLDNEVKYKPGIIAIILILITMGFSAFIELFGFISVMILNSANQGYFKNMLDIMYGLIGALIGSGLVIYYHMSYIRKKK